MNIILKYILKNIKIQWFHVYICQRQRLSYVSNCQNYEYDANFSFLFSSYADK